MPLPSQSTLEARLNDFSDAIRRDALAALDVLVTPAPPDAANVNMHCHSFFSYNAHGWSPSRIAWEARKLRLYAAGLCDFDLLDGLEEFLSAARLLELRAAVHLETRAYIPALAQHEINSPGEPGITYIMACGFPALPDPGTPAHDGLRRLRQSAQDRNTQRINLINTALPDIAIDFDKNLAPLTPSRLPTERHIVQAYITSAERAYPNLDARHEFWARLANRTPAQITALTADRPAFDELIRAILLKRGGIGYTAPTPETFPDAADFCAWALDCDAIPTVTWLDGTASGEADPAHLLDTFCQLGCAAVNIIPDRNWNIKNSDEKTAKLRHLADFIRESNRRHLPVNIGTELNKSTNLLTDDLAVPELKPFAPCFLHGAQVMVGHTLLARYADAPLLGPRAGSLFKTPLQRNAFYARVGALPPLDRETAEHLSENGPDRAFAYFADSIK